MAIALVEAWTVRFQLRRPVVFDTVTFSERDYAIVRLTDDSGTHGFAYCLARNAPVVATIGAIAPLVLGTDPGFSEQLWSTLYRSTITHGQRGVTLRAISLIDIALWDIRARQAGLPLYQLLGALRKSVEVSVGGGYYRERREPDEIASELSGYVDKGFRHLKIPAGGLGAADEERWVRLAREAVGNEMELAIDAHWTWQTVEDATAVMQRLDQFELSWVEDPLLPEALVATSELRKRIRTPVAIGDEQSGRWAYQNLIALEAADIWRVDVTCVGGVSELRKIAAIAGAWGIQISTHIYPELHIHCALAEESVKGIEYVAPEADIDLSYKFVRPLIEPRDGRAGPYEEPGLGIDLDWELIERTATEHVST